MTLLEIGLFRSLKPTRTVTVGIESLARSLLKSVEVEDNVQAEPEAPEEVQVFVDVIQHMLANPNEKLLADQSPTALDNREHWYEWVEKNQKIIDRVPEFSEFRAIHEGLKNDLGR